MSAKFQILVTVEFDSDSLRRTYGPVLAPPTAQIVLDDINRELRLWAGSNPYALQDPGHLELRLTHATGNAAPVTPDMAERIARDLVNTANDLTTLARLCRAA